MGMINQSTLQVCQVKNQTAPAEGPRAVPISVDFSVAGGSPYSLDYSNQQAGKFSQLQALYIDNAGNGSAVSVTINGVGQVITCPANSQGYFPVLCMNPIKLEFASNGNVAVPIILLNFPVAPAVWNT